MLAKRRKLIKMGGYIDKPGTKDVLKTFPNKNPMLNDVVLHNLFGYLSFENMKNCRLVCKTWKNIAYPEFEKKKAVMVMPSIERVISILCRYMVGQEDEFGFVNFRFTGNRFDRSIHLQEFFERFGHRIKFVSFINFKFWIDKDSKYCHLSYISKLPNVEEIVFDCKGEKSASQGNLEHHPEQQTFQLTNLKSLRVVGKLFENYTVADGTYLEEVLKMILMGAPRIKEISTNVLKTIKVTGTDSIHLSKSVQNALQSDEVGIPGLSKLSLLHPSSQDLISLINKNLKLDSLNLCICAERGTTILTEDALKRFLKSVSSTLAVLRLGTGSKFYIGSNIGLQNFGSLRTLELSFANNPSPNVFAGHPKLETLELTRCNLPKNFSDISEQLPETLTTFVTQDVKIRGNELITGERLTIQVCTKFPHLKKLKLETLPDSSLTMICMYLKVLEELYMLDSRVTDFGITGTLGHTNENESSVPNLTSLKCLRKLAIGSPNFTDNAIIHGILKCSRLRHLVIYSPEMTGRSLRAIVDGMEIFSLRTICCYNIDADDLDYAYNKLKGLDDIGLNSEPGPKTSAAITQVIKKYCVSLTSQWNLH